MDNNLKEISITWSIGDVQSIDNTLSDNECMEVLNQIERTHDANIGVNWDVIKSAIENFKKWE